MPALLRTESIAVEIEPGRPPHAPLQLLATGNDLTTEIQSLNLRFKLDSLIPSQKTPREMDVALGQLASNDDVLILSFFIRKQGSQRLIKRLSLINPIGYDWIEFDLLKLIGNHKPILLGQQEFLEVQTDRPLGSPDRVVIFGGYRREMSLPSPPTQPSVQSIALKRWVLVYGSNPTDRFEFAPEAYPGWLFAELLVRADTEATYDKLTFFGNGVLVDEWSGATPLKMLRFPIQAGNHQLTLTYTKDVQDSSGEDRVWVHSLRVISPESAWAADFSGGMPSYFQLSGDANWEAVNGILQTPAMLNDQSATINWNVSLLAQEE